MRKMTERRMRNAIKCYDDLMFKYGYDHLTISEGETHGWNLRDMMSEVAYQLECVLDPMSSQGDEYEDALQTLEWFKGGTDKHSVQRCKEAIAVINHRNEKVADLRKFLKRYRYDVYDLKCTVRHSSAWDN